MYRKEQKHLQGGRQRAEAGVIRQRYQLGAYGSDTAGGLKSNNKQGSGAGERDQ